MDFPHITGKLLDGIVRRERQCVLGQFLAQGVVFTPRAPPSGAARAGTTR